jgi:hypothetical protein
MYSDDEAGGRERAAPLHQRVRDNPGMENR